VLSYYHLALHSEDELTKLKASVVEEAFTGAQAERLRAASCDFGADVDQLKGVIDDRSAATERSAKTAEILSYISSAVDIASHIVIEILPYL
jgi:hypothetical protein